MCGIVGIYSQKNVNTELYDALTVLQHRGQDAAGIVTCQDGHLFQKKGLGLVRSVFRSRDMENLTGNYGIGHVRYPTSGSSGPALAQPFYVNSPYGISLAHNGNLVNSAKLSSLLYKTDKRHLNTDSDSEVILNVLAHELDKAHSLSPTAEDIFAAVTKLHERCSGAYACAALIAGHGLLGFRDPMGIRPLVFGSRKRKGVVEYMLASESSALAVLGFDSLGDVAPGEAIYIDSQFQMHRQLCAEDARPVPCIFEHVYLARPDSTIDGIHIYKTRLRQGLKLAEKIQRIRPDQDIDVVIPIPDTSRVAAQALAEKLGIKLREGLMKNRYIGRTFIMPGQAVRKKSVRQKLNAIESEFKGRNVLLVDDSIVRGTTCTQIIQMAREAGANKVYFASAAPPVRFPNVYGIDMPSPEELIAHGRTEEEISQLIGVDWLVYQDLEDLIEASREGNPEIKEFECSVFTGEYVTGDIDSDYLGAIEEKRKDSVRREGYGLGGETATVGLYNDTAQSS
jgi:amidophosphoribosyltransferase|tara:strand:- start:42780 stop:44309 length:1530 start_codon:yes stop_codon:yes gene_type:complete